MKGLNFRLNDKESTKPISSVTTAWWDWISIVNSYTQLSNKEKKELWDKYISDQNWTAISEILSIPWEKIEVSGKFFKYELTYDPIFRQYLSVYLDNTTGKRIPQLLMNFWDNPEECFKNTQKDEEKSYNYLVNHNNSVDSLSSLSPELAQIVKSITVNMTYSLNNSAIDEYISTGRFTEFGEKMKTSPVSLNWNLWNWYWFEISYNKEQLEFQVADFDGSQEKSTIDEYKEAFSIMQLEDIIKLIYEKYWRN